MIYTDGSDHDLGFLHRKALGTIATAVYSITNYMTIHIVLFLSTRRQAS